MAPRTWNELDEISQRGRVFSQSFPGTTASDVWRAGFASAHSHPVAPDPSENQRKHDQTNPAKPVPVNERSIVAASR